MEGVTAEEIGALFDTLKNQSENCVIWLSGVEDSKLQVVLGTSSKMSLKTDVRTAFKDVQALLDLRGGGRPDFIRAGGVTPSNLATRLEKVRASLIDFMSPRVSG